MRNGETPRPDSMSSAKEGGVEGEVEGERRTDASEALGTIATELVMDQQHLVARDSAIEE